MENCSNEETEGTNCRLKKILVKDCNVTRAARTNIEVF